MVNKRSSDLAAYANLREFTTFLASPRKVVIEVDRSRADLRLSVRRGATSDRIFSKIVGNICGQAERRRRIRLPVAEGFNRTI